MSTGLEAIAARHLGAEVLGISLVTNLAAGLAGQGLSHAEVVEAGRSSASRMGALLAGILPRVCSAAGILALFCYLAAIFALVPDRTGPADNRDRGRWGPAGRAGDGRTDGGCGVRVPGGADRGAAGAGVFRLRLRLRLQLRREAA